MGVWHFMKKSRHTAEHEAEGTAQDPAQSDLLGRDRTRRVLAAQLGVNPYSHNPALADELDKCAWVVVSGGLTITLGGAAIPVVGHIVTGVGAADTLSKEQVQLNPAELNQRTLQQLIAQGIAPETASLLAANPNFDAWTLAALANTLDTVRAIPGLDSFAREAASAENEIDAFYYSRIAQLMAAYHSRTSRLQVIEAPEKIVSFTDAQGNVVVPVWVDYVQWTPSVEEVTRRLQERAGRLNAARLVILSTGDLSQRTQKELTQRNIAYS